MHRLPEASRQMARDAAKFYRFQDDSGGRHPAFCHTSAQGTHLPLPWGTQALLLLLLLLSHSSTAICGACININVTCTAAWLRQRCMPDLPSDASCHCTYSKYATKVSYPLTTVVSDCDLSIVSISAGSVAAAQLSASGWGAEPKHHHSGASSLPGRRLFEVLATMG